MTAGGLADYDGVDWSKVEPHIRHGHEMATTKVSAYDYVLAAQALEQLSPQRGRPLGPRLRRPAHPDLGDPAARRGVGPDGTARDARAAGGRRRRARSPSPPSATSPACPALSLPLHWTEDDVPVGTMLTGAPLRRGDPDSPRRPARSGPPLGRASRSRRGRRLACAVAATSAGILLYRGAAEALEVLLVHPGGPVLGEERPRRLVDPEGRNRRGGGGRGPARCASSRRSWARRRRSRPRSWSSSARCARRRQDRRLLGGRGRLRPGDPGQQHLRDGVAAALGRQREFPEVDRAEWFGPEPARGKMTSSPGRADRPAARAPRTASERSGERILGAWRHRPSQSA